MEPMIFVIIGEIFVLLTVLYVHKELSERLRRMEAHPNMMSEDGDLSIKKGRSSPIRRGGPPANVYILGTSDVEEIIQRRTAMDKEGLQNLSK